MANVVHLTTTAKEVSVQTMANVVHLTTTAKEVSVQTMANVVHLTTMVKDHSVRVRVDLITVTITEIIVAAIVEASTTIAVKLSLIWITLSVKKLL